MASYELRISFTFVSLCRKGDVYLYSEALSGCKYWIALFTVEVNSIIGIANFTILIKGLHPDVHFEYA